MVHSVEGMPETNREAVNLHSQIQLSKTRKILIWARTRPQNNRDANSNIKRQPNKKRDHTIVGAHAPTILKRTCVIGGVEKHRLADNS